jgi:O-antigen/teichoic acid export membrane protein
MNPLPKGAGTPAGSVARRFFVNVASLAGVQMANMLLPLLTVPYLVRIIGPERLGLLSFSQAYIAYFTLIINYGFELSAVRSIAAHRDDRGHTQRIFNEVMAGKTLLWAFSTVLFAIVTFCVPDFRAHLLLHVCTYLSCIGAVLFPLWLYQAMEDLGRVAIFNLFVKVVFSASIFILIRRPEDYIYQTLSLSVAQVLVGAVALGAALRRFQLRFAWPGAAALARRFRADRTLFFSSLMITLYAGSSTFILGLRADAYSVGIFAAGVRLESIARSFVSLALNQAFFPVVAHAFGRGREAGLAMVRKISGPLVVMLGLISVAVWIAAPFFIRLFYGREFDGAVEVLRIVAALTLTIGLSNLFGFHVMLNLRMDRAFFAITGLGSVIGMALTFFLVGAYRHIGAAWAWVATEVYITVAMYWFLRARGISVLAPFRFSEATALLARLLPKNFRTA